MTITTPFDILKLNSKSSTEILFLLLFSCFFFKYFNYLVILKILSEKDLEVIWILEFSTFFSQFSVLFFGIPDNILLAAWHQK